MEKRREKRMGGGRGKKGRERETERGREREEGEMGKEGGGISFHIEGDHTNNTEAAAAVWVTLKWVEDCGHHTNT